MANATEIAFLPLKEGVKVSDPKLLEGLGTVVQQNGSLRMYIGQQVEHPEMMMLFIDWTTVDHHQKFIDSEAYGPFVQNVVSFLSGPPVLYHAPLEPFPPFKSFGAATEFITAYFPTTYSSEDQQKFHDDMKKLTEIVRADWDGCQGSAGGWVIEELDLPGTSEKAKAYVKLIGWTSVESHMKYRETQSFKDNIHLLRGAKDLKNMSVFHVVNSEYKQ